MPMVHHPIHKTKGLCYLIKETNPTLFFKIFLQFLVHKAKRFSYLLIKQGVSYAQGAPPPPPPQKKKKKTLTFIISIILHFLVHEAKGLY